MMTISITRKDNNYTDGRETNWIPKQKTKHFIILFESIGKHAGTEECGRILIGISGRTVNELKHGRASQLTAQKILDAYNEIKKLNKD